MDNTSKIELLNQLLENPGWKIITDHLKENLDWLTEQALDSDNEKMRQRVTLSKRELFLKWRKYNTILMGLPQAIIESLKSGTAVEQPTDFDPFFKEKDFEKTVDN